MIFLRLIMDVLNILILYAKPRNNKRAGASSACTVLVLYVSFEGKAGPRK